MKYAMCSQVLTQVRLSRKASRIFRQASQKTTLKSLTGLDWPPEYGETTGRL
jgi:hypothetical protein